VKKSGSQLAHPKPHVVTSPQIDPAGHGVSRWWKSPTWTTRSGAIDAAMSAMALNGHWAGSLQACSSVLCAVTFIRQPVSPMTRIRSTCPFGNGSDRAPSFALAVPAGMRRSQVVTGNDVGATHPDE
jgi:hypothetical protein